MALGRKLLAAVFVAALSVSGAATADDEIRLTYHSAFGQAALNEASRVWMDEVEARTDGRVTFTRLFGGTLGKFAGQPDGLKARSFDVGQLSAVYNPGLYPHATTTIMTFLTDNADAHNLASHEFFNTPDLQAEFDALNQKFMFVGQWVRIEMLSYDHVNTMEELAQIKIRAHGGAADALEAAGITGYAIPWGELPAAAERRVVDAGIMGAPAAAADFGFGDIFEYWYGYMPIYYFPMTLVMNKEAWEGAAGGYPADHRRPQRGDGSPVPGADRHARRGGRGKTDGRARCKESQVRRTRATGNSRSGCQGKLEGRNG